MLASALRLCSRHANSAAIRSLSSTTVATATSRLVALCSSTPARLAQQSFTRFTAPASLFSARLFHCSAPHSDEAAKEYSPKVEALVADISSMTLLEVADLVDCLKTRLNISDMPVAAVGAVAAPAQDAAPAIEEKTEFEVKLIKFADNAKIKVIKEVRNVLPDLKLAEAKKLVESLPASLKVDISKEDAEKIKEQLAAVGGEVEIA